MSAAVAVGVVGAVDISSSSESSQALGKTLRIVSVALFLVIVVLMGIHTLLVLKESSGLSESLSVVALTILSNCAMFCRVKADG